MRNRRTVVVAVVAVVVIAGGAVATFRRGSHRNPGADRTVSGSDVSGTVGATGLVLRHPDGAELRIPSGALAEGATVKLSHAHSSLTDHLGALATDARAWDVAGPEPARPVQLVLPYEPAKLPTGARPLVVTFDELSSWWLPVPTTADPATRRLTAQLPSFSWKTWIADRTTDVSTGASWLEYLAGRATGNRSGHPDCAQPKQPTWVKEVTTNPDPNARLFACAVAEGNGFALKVNSNRGYPFSLVFDQPFTKATSSVLDDGLAGIMEKLSAAAGNNRMLLLPTGSGVVAFNPPPTASGYLQANARRDSVALGIFFAMGLLHLAGEDLPVGKGKTLGVWTVDCVVRMIGATSNGANGDVVGMVTGLKDCLQEALRTEAESWGFDVDKDLWRKSAADRLPASGRRAISALRWLWAIDVAKYTLTVADLLINDSGAAGAYTDIGLRWVGARMPTAADPHVVRFDGIGEFSLRLTAADLRARGYVDRGNLYEETGAACVGYTKAGQPMAFSVESRTGRVLAISTGFGEPMRTEVGGIRAGSTLAQLRTAFAGCGRSSN